MGAEVLRTERLILRRPREADREPFARMNADPRVMEFFPATLLREESDALMERIKAHREQHGFSWCAAELQDTGEFIGFIGLAVPGSRRRLRRAWRSGGDWQLSIGD